MGSAAQPTALGVAVGPGLFEHWRCWLAPEVQPFFVDSLRPWPASVVGGSPLTAELGHTYKSWRVDRSLEILWLDEASFWDLPRSRRTELIRTQLRHGRGAVPSVPRWSDVIDAAALRSQADGRRFVWWPSLVDADPEGVLSRVVEASPDGSAPDGAPSRHDDVDNRTWDRCTVILPEARRLAGSFPPSSGPNCFATVMAAAGVDGAEHACMLEAPFLEWLDAACRSGGHDDAPGTALVWRDRGGRPVHAAITIGDGWALEKASAEWWTPCAVRGVRDVVRAARAPGQRLERHHITD